MKQETGEGTLSKKNEPSVRERLTTYSQSALECVGRSRSDNWVDPRSRSDRAASEQYQPRV